MNEIQDFRDHFGYNEWDFGDINKTFWQTMKEELNCDVGYMIDQLPYKSIETIEELKHFIKEKC